MSKIVDIAFLEREQLCAIVLKKEMKVIHLQTSIFEEKISELMFFVGFCWKWRIYCRENRKAWRFLENFDNGNSMLWSSLIPGKNNTRSSSFLFPTEKFFFAQHFGKRLKTTFCQNVKTDLVSKMANLLRGKYEPQKVCYIFWQRRFDLASVPDTRKKTQNSILTQWLEFCL